MAPTGWQSFWKITFPLMLPVSMTAVVLRIIFELKLADIVINVTAGGPGGATDTVSSFIYREYRDRSNVGYGTMLAEFYLVIIIIFVTPAAALWPAAGCGGSHEGSAPVAGRCQRPSMNRPRRSRRAGRDMLSGRVLIYGALIFWAFICLSRSIGRSRPPSRSAVDVTQGHLIPWIDLHALLERLALPRPVAGYDLPDLDRARRIHAALREQRAGLSRRLAARAHHRIAGGLWAQPLRVQIRALDAQQGHLCSSSCRS